MSSRGLCIDTWSLCREACQPGMCKRQAVEKPRIYLYNGRWHVLMEGWPIHGYLLRENAYIRAETIWSKRKK